MESTTTSWRDQRATEREGYLSYVDEFGTEIVAWADGAGVTWLKDPQTPTAWPTTGWRDDAGWRASPEGWSGHG